MSRYPALIVIGTLITTAANAQTPTSLAPGDNAISAVSTSYTCEQAEDIKFNREKYNGLDIEQRVILDAQWNKCDLEKRQNKANAQPDDRDIIVFANPAPTSDSSRVFFGLVKKRDLENAEKNCTGAGKGAGVALTVVGAATGADGTGQLGRAVYNYSEVSCAGLKSAAERNNLMVFLAPAAIVSKAIEQKLTKDILDKIPLVSDADKRNIQKAVEKVIRPAEVTVNNREVKVKTPLGTAKFRRPKW